MFATEAQLVEAFCPHVPTFVRSSVSNHRREVEVGRRIADIAAMGFQASPPTDLLTMFEDLYALDLLPLAALVSRPLTLAGLAGKFHSPTSRAAERLARFERAGLVTANGGPLFVATDWIEHIPLDTVAFEAKLHDWREAVAQATDHASHVRRAWVVMPMTKRDNRQLREACAAAGVGLALVGHDEVIRPVRPRSDQAPALERREQALRMLWGLSRRPEDHTFTS